MAIRVAELIGNGIEKQVSSFCVKVHYKMLKNVHVGRVCNGGSCGSATLAVNKSDRLSSNIEH